MCSGLLMWSSCRNGWGFGVEEKKGHEELNQRVANRRRH